MCYDEAATRNEQRKARHVQQVRNAAAQHSDDVDASQSTF